MNGTEKTQCVPHPATLAPRAIAKLAKRRTGSLCVLAGGTHNAN